MEKIVEILVKAYDEIRFYLNSDISWFKAVVPDVENCFVFIQKHAMSSYAHLLLFGKAWPVIDPSMKKKEFLQRLMLIVRSDFIFSLSSVEYFLKLIIKQSQRGPLVDWVNEETEKALKQNRKFWMYLSGIIMKSKKTKLITDSQFINWDGMIKLRNVIIHNNGIVEKDTIFRIGEIDIEGKAGMPVSFPLVNYPRFIEVLISVTRNWIDTYLKEHTMKPKT